MSNIVTSTSTSYNTSHVVSSLTTRKLTDSEFRRYKARLHSYLDTIAETHDLTFRQRSILHRLLSCANANHQYSGNQLSLAAYFTCSLDTIQRELKILKERHLISVTRRGRTYDKTSKTFINQTNIVTLTCINTELSDGYRSLRRNLTPSPIEKDLILRDKLKNQTKPPIPIPEPPHTEAQTEEINENLRRLSKTYGLKLDFLINR